MAGQVFTVLYTHQKTKKSKVWQDGILKLLPEGNQAVLYSDKGQRLESVFLKTSQVGPGDDLESDRFLITVETEGEISAASQTSTEAKEVPKYTTNGLKPVGLRPPSGLKRKFIGFQGPREVSKKPSVGVEEAMTASSAQISQGRFSLPAQLYTTSPLFAPSYRSQAGSTQTPDFCPDKIVTWRNPNVNGANFSCNFTVSAEQSVEREHVADVPVEGGKVKQSIRSTAQILALLKSQPSEMGSCTDLAEPCSEEPLVRCNSEVLRNACTSSAIVLQREKHRQHPHALSPIKPVTTKSRWDIYLDQCQADNTVGDNNDLAVLSSSPDKRPKAGPVICILDNKAKHEGIRVEDMFTSEADNLSIKDDNSGVLVDLLKTDKQSNKLLSSTDQQSSDISCVPGLSHRQSLIPETHTTSHITATVHTDDFNLDDKSDEHFSEVTFNLMDSFDFAELDDGCTTVDLPPPQSASAVAKEGLFKDNILEKKGPETCADHVLEEEKYTNGLTDSNCKDCIASMVSDVSCCKVESECAVLSNVHSEAKTGECNSKPKGISETDSNNFGYCKSKSPPQLPVTDIQHSLKGIWCNNMIADSPEQSHLGINLSLLRSLTKPSSAIESLNVLKVNSPSTAKKRDTDAETCLENGAAERQNYRFLMKQIK